VLGRRHTQEHRPERELVALLDLGDRLEMLGEQTAEAARHDDGNRPVKTLERRDVEMVVVSVGDQDRREAFHHVCGQGNSPPQMPDPAPQQRVGEHCEAVELEADGPVADIRNGAQGAEYARVVANTTASRWRMLLAWTLVVLGILLAVVAVVAGYVRYQALDNETFKETSEELIADPVIRDQIATTLVEQLYANVDVEAELQQQLPPDQKGLAGPLAAATRELGDRAAHRLLERPRAQELWVNSTTRAHRQLIAVLEDDTGAISTEGGVVVLNLQPLVIQVGERVAVFGAVSERLGPDAGRIEIMEADQLETAQDLTQLFKQVATFIWLVPFLFWAVALWLARGRRRAIVRTIALGLVAAGLLVLVTRRLGGEYVVDGLVQTDAVRPAASNAWDILTELLADGGWTMIGIGVIALFGVWLAGPSPSGSAARRELAPFLARPELAYGVVAVLFLLLLLWGPVVQTRRLYAVVAAALLLALGVEVLRRQAAREFPDARANDLGASARSAYTRMRGSGGRDPRVADLARLERLKEQGLLNDEELAAEKARLLN
jgi:hypothetical protein